VIWPCSEQVTNEQDATSEGPPQVADVLVRNMVWTNTAQGPLCLYPGLHNHGSTLCAMPKQSDRVPVVHLKQGAKTCQANCIATAMRMHGLGRLAYDASEGSGSQTATSLMLALLRTDWSKFKRRITLATCHQFSTRPLLNHSISKKVLWEPRRLLAVCSQRFAQRLFRSHQEEDVYFLSRVDLLSNITRH
jgi:hypothetical protein